MVLYSTGVAFASVAVCEAPALIEETDCQFNNSYSALSSHIPFEHSRNSHTHTYTDSHTHTQSDVYKCSFIHEKRGEVRHPTPAVHK